MESHSAGTLQGRVLYKASGAPVDGASIVVVRGAGPMADIAQLTDAQGRFTLHGLAAGEWVLAAYGNSGERGTGRARVLPGLPVQLVIQVA
jgi:uncharacterized GH25 family protein